MNKQEIEKLLKVLAWSGDECECCVEKTILSVLENFPEIYKNFSLFEIKEIVNNERDKKEETHINLGRG